MVVKRFDHFHKLILIPLLRFRRLDRVVISPGWDEQTHYHTRRLLPWLQRSTISHTCSLSVSKAKMDELFLIKDSDCWPNSARRLGQISASVQKAVLDTLAKMFVNNLPNATLHQLAGLNRLPHQHNKLGLKANKSIGKIQDLLAPTAMRLGEEIAQCGASPMPKLNVINPDHAHKHQYPESWQWSNCSRSQSFTDTYAQRSLYPTTVLRNRILICR